MDQLTGAGSPAQKGSTLDHARVTALFIPLLICCFLVITSTVSLSSEIPVYDVKRIAQFILLFTVFVTTLAHPSLRNAFASQLSRMPRLVGIGVTLFFLLGFASSILNADSVRGLIYSLVDVSLLGLLLGMALVIAACRNLAGPYFDRLVLSAITLLGLGVGVQELTGFWAALSAGGAYHFDIALAYFSFPRNYNQLQTWTIPLLAALPLVFYRNRLAVALCLLSLGLHWYVLLVTGARGSVISLAAAFAVASLLSPPARRVVFKWQTAGVLLGILIYAGLFAVTQSGAESDLSGAISSAETAANTAGHNPGPAKSPNQFYDRSIGRNMWQSSGRTDLWRSALKDGLENPVLGIGPMNFACKGPVLRAGSPHNFALQILSEWGIPAALILLALGLSLLKMLLGRLKKKTGGETSVVLLHSLLVISALAALVHLLVSSLLLTPASQVAAALVAGWLLGTIPQKKVIPKNRSAIVLLTFSLFCSLALLPFAYQETSRMSDYREQLPTGEDGRPRLWQLGRACSADVR